MSTSSSVVNVDDTDTTQISYQGFWKQMRHANADFQTTVHFSNSSTASATFVFSGTSVTVFGTLPPSTPPTSKYTLDDLEPVIFTAPSVPSSANQKQLYASPPLSDGMHKLSIAPTMDGPHFYLDYIQYTPGSATTSPADSSRTGQIVGGAIGGAAALGLIVVGIAVFLRRRRRHPRTEFGLAGDGTGQNRFSATPDPFVPSQMSTSPFLVPSTKSQHHWQAPESVETSSIVRALPTPPQAATSTGSSEALEPIQHRDAGSVPVHLQREEIPPSYDDRV